MNEEAKRIKKFIKNMRSISFLDYQIKSAIDGHCLSCCVPVAEKRESNKRNQHSKFSVGDLFYLSENWAANWYRYSINVPFSYVLTDGEDVPQSSGKTVYTSKKHPLYVYHKVSKNKNFPYDINPFENVQWSCYEEEMPWWAVRFFAKITSVTKKRIQDLTTQEINKLGFIDTNIGLDSHKNALTNFLFFWDCCYKTKYSDNPFVWFMDFEKPQEIRNDKNYLSISNYYNRSEKVSTGI